MKHQTRPKETTIKLHVTVSKDNFEKVKAIFPYMTPSIIIDHCFDLILRSKIYAVEDFIEIQEQKK